MRPCASFFFLAPSARRQPAAACAVKRRPARLNAPTGSASLIAPAKDFAGRGRRQHLSRLGVLRQRMPAMVNDGNDEVDPPAHLRALTVGRCAHPYSSQGRTADAGTNRLSQVNASTAAPVVADSATASPAGGIRWNSPVGSLVDARQRLQFSLARGRSMDSSQGYMPTNGL